MWPTAGGSDFGGRPNRPIRWQLNWKWLSTNTKPGGHWPRKGVWRCAALKTPFHFSPVVRKGPIIFKQTCQFTVEILASTASIFAHILALKPPNLKFSAHKPSKFGNFQFTRGPKFWNFQFTSPFFQRQIKKKKKKKKKFASPTFRKSGPHTPKKLSAPLPPEPNQMNNLPPMHILTWAIELVPWWPPPPRHA